ncbi:A/G-specific adenine glycosylase [Caenimonas koreensis DSM 17982]|uniref:Adenine DNA glycosylase n=1 Tax=Caenimonas koreensis DSM 17982 TaxID=1121255 RepID=A0A844B596_9BURK|nr:A/G-specific adenine glycosylase [Caenimonas koreensis]MRD48393.1 A/G-specific adenine glycosylase [Caenimonas koreensis DSM 17982]
MTQPVPGFASRVVRWQRAHGRHSLPWQQTRDPYRVWLSEVMLQQTQVTTVLGYYAKFLERFPDVTALSAADIDDVFSLWSGLGYYSRARNLHRCAQEVMLKHGGAFPRSAQELQTLPGIGRSTAAAIAAFCFDERIAILDGNVKRVLARVLAFDADLATATNEKLLWSQAQALVPARKDDMPAYTQGLMDLGATVCLARSPSCLLCPLHSQCGAAAAGKQENYPVKTRKLKRSAQSLWLLQLRTKAGHVWLDKRRPTGVWAGLYCLPVFDSREALLSALPPAQHSKLQDAAPLLHVLTHKDLHLHPVVVTVPKASMAGLPGEWFAEGQWPALGLPAPIRKLLEASAG